MTAIYIKKKVKPQEHDESTFMNSDLSPESSQYLWCKTIVIMDEIFNNRSNGHLNTGTVDKCRPVPMLASRVFS